MASVPAGAVKPRNWWLFFSTVLLLLQFFLRSHNILAYPRDANEKDLFSLERITTTALPFQRLSVALLSLLAGAALYAIGKRLFSRRVGIMTQWLYVMLPFTIFYDRMVSETSIDVVATLIPIFAILIRLKSPLLQIGAILALQIIVIFSIFVLGKSTITTENFADNLRYATEATKVFYWSPALWITFLAWLILLWQHPRWGILLGLLLGLKWLPLLVEISFPHNTRAFEAGIPFLLLILVTGLYEASSLIREPGRRDSVERLITVSFLVYGLAWGLPFWETLVEHPQDLNIPAEIR